MELPTLKAIYIYSRLSQSITKIVKEYVFVNAENQYDWKKKVVSNKVCKV